MNLIELHDAVLEKIEINWEERTCQISIREQQFHRKIKVSSFSELVLPRQQPWGPSSSITSATQSKQKLEIEMQSGDVLTFCGEIQIA